MASFYPSILLSWLSLSQSQSSPCRYGLGRSQMYSLVLICDWDGLPSRNQFVADKLGEKME